jgi:hypothetical protein
VHTQPGPNATVLYLDPKLIGSDGRANPAFITVPSTPGQRVQYVYLYGPGFWNVDSALIKEIPIHERVHFLFQAEFLNIFNHPTFLVGTSSFIPGPSGTNLGGITSSIQSTTFGQNTSLANGARNIQLRAQITF